MKQGIFRQAWRWLARIDVAAILIVAVLLLAALGSLFPQSPSAATAEGEQIAQWEALARGRYGPLTGLLQAVGAFGLYRSPLFLVPLALLALATLACMLQRWRAAWDGAFRQPVRLPEAVLDAAPHTAVLRTEADGDDSGRQAALSAIAREALERRELRVRSQGAEGLILLRGDRNRLASLGTLAEHLAVLLLLLGVISSTGLGWREVLTLRPQEAADIGHGSRFALRNEGFTIVRYGDGSPAAYDAEVAVLEDSQQMPRRIGVNEPLAYRGVWVYLQGYRPGEAGSDVTLLAVHDPGYGLVIAAGVLLLLGMTLSVYFPRSSVHIRVAPEGTLRLAGWADRRAYHFDRDFAGLVADLQRALEEKCSR